LNDSFRWDPGDGSDVIEGQRGHDTMLFNGAAANEDITMTANGERLSCTPTASAGTTRSPSAKSAESR
jgi:hypothetical protein